MIGKPIGQSASSLGHEGQREVAGTGHDRQLGRHFGDLAQMPTVFWGCDVVTLTIDQMQRTRQSGDLVGHVEALDQLPKLDFAFCTAGAPDTPNPPGGVIERHPATREPNGTLRETAMQLVNEVIPEYTFEERKEALIAYQQMAAKAGVTLAHDAMLEDESIAAFEALQDEGLLVIRFKGAMLMEPDKGIKKQIEFLQQERKRHTGPYFKTHAAKIFVDGVVEGGTAFLLEEYAHKPGYFGETIWSADELQAASAALAKEDFQIHYHVIGDAAACVTLDALEYAQRVNDKASIRPLITHLQLVEPSDIERFKQLGVIGIPQPFWFKIDEYYWELAVPYLGEKRAAKQYPMASLISAGVKMASASDFPVTIPFDPLIGIETGVTRKAVGETSAQVLWPEERVSLAEMIKSYTYNGAYANFLENSIGSLETGKIADLVVLDQNLFEIPPNQIAKAKVLLTMVGGKQVYRAPEF